MARYDSTRVDLLKIVVGMGYMYETINEPHLPGPSLIPRPSRLQFLIACSMQKRRRKASETESRA